MFQQISKNDFLHKYWQQQPLVFCQAFIDLIGVIDGNDLAGLACEEVVESRVIRGFELDQPWHCQSGPFTEEYFADVAKTNWTLLVQGVDQWIDDIHAVLERFQFLPRWRLEDIMVSYAPTGGGVGPHFDYYDVFLVQISGKRQWQLGAHCDEHTALQVHESLKLMASFDAQQTHLLSAGDALYIPAGLSHWGRATTDDCITLSMGFRAPSQKDLVTEALEIVAQQLSEHIRYTDTVKAIDHSPHKINQFAHNQLSGILKGLSPALLQRSVEEAFGRLVTDSRYTRYDAPDAQWTDATLKKKIDKESIVSLTHLPHCRMAYSQTHLFVNGEAYACEEHFSQALCEQVIRTPLSKEHRPIVVELLNLGFIELVT